MPAAPDVYTKLKWEEMNLLKMTNKPYYRVKGRYKDGRQRIVIEAKASDGKKSSVAIPKPEDLIKLLGREL